MLNLFDYIAEAQTKPVAARLLSSFDEFRLVFGEKVNTLTASPEAIAKYNLAKFGLEEFTLNTQDPSSLGVFAALKQYAPEGKEVVAIVYLLDKEAKDKKPNYFANSRLQFKENEDISVSITSDGIFDLSSVLDNIRDKNEKFYDFTLDALNIEKFFAEQEAHAIAAGKDPQSVKDIYSRIPVTFYYKKRGSEDISYTRRLVDIDKFYFICKEAKVAVEENVETTEVVA